MNKVMNFKLREDWKIFCLPEVVLAAEGQFCYTQPFCEQE